MKVLYRSADIRDAEELTRMSMDYYSEVLTRKDRAVNKIVATLNFYTANSNMGEVLMIERDGITAGYSIAFRFWSDEYGGLMLAVDCLFIQKQFRNQGVAKAFLRHYISREKENPQAAGIELETSPGNAAAAGLFTALGLSPNSNRLYIMLFR